MNNFQQYTLTAKVSMKNEKPDIVESGFSFLGAVLEDCSPSCYDFACDKILTMDSEDMFSLACRIAATLGSWERKNTIAIDSDRLKTIFGFIAKVEKHAMRNEHIVTNIEYVWTLKK